MSFFFFNDTATTEIYTLSLHDALPISPTRRRGRAPASPVPSGAAGTRDSHGRRWWRGPTRHAVPSAPGGSTAAPGDRVSDPARAGRLRPPREIGRAHV